MTAGHRTNRQRAFPHRGLSSVGRGPRVRNVHLAAVLCTDGRLIRSGRRDFGLGMTQSGLITRKIRARPIDTGGNELIVCTLAPATPATSHRKPLSLTQLNTIPTRPPSPYH